MPDTKPHPEQQLKLIHEILNQPDLTNETIVERIRAVLYGELEPFLEYKVNEQGGIENIKKDNNKER
jgi:hypothetical protein